MSTPFFGYPGPTCHRDRIDGFMLPLLALALLLGGCETPLPQMPGAGIPATLPAPQIAVGDSWTYKVRDGFTQLPREDQRHEVTQVGADRIVVTAQVEHGDGTQIYDREWNWLRRPATDLQTFEYTPAYPAYAFPLTAGKSWSVRVTARDPRDGRRFPVRIDGVALGWERVKVPAGEFDALKIQRRVYFDYWEYATRGHSIIREHEWYAPGVKWAVKRETRALYLTYMSDMGNAAGFLPVAGGGGGNRDGGGPHYVQDDWLIYELASFSVH